MCREPKVLNCELLARARTGDCRDLLLCMEELLAVMDDAGLHLAAAHFDLAVQLVRKQAGASPTGG